LSVTTRRLTWSATWRLCVATITVVPRAYREGDGKKARGHEETAGLFAVQLAGAESMAAELADARDRSAGAAAAAPNSPMGMGAALQRSIASQRSVCVTPYSGHFGECPDVF